MGQGPAPLPTVDDLNKTAQSAINDPNANLPLAGRTGGQPAPGWTVPQGPEMFQVPEANFALDPRKAREVAEGYRLAQLRNQNIVNTFASQVQWFVANEFLTPAAAVELIAQRYMANAIAGADYSTELVQPEMIMGWPTGSLLPVGVYQGPGRPLAQLPAPPPGKAQS